MKTKKWKEKGDTKPNDESRGKNMKSHSKKFKGKLYIETFFLKILYIFWMSRLTINVAKCLERILSFYQFFCFPHALNQSQIKEREFC